MAFSGIPLLIAVVFGFVWFITRRLHRLGVMSSPQRDWMAALLVILLIWGLLISHQTSATARAHERLLEMLPGFWLPYLPIALTVALILTNATLRNALRTLVDGTPPHWLSGIQVVRVFALGILIQASNGEFPVLLAWSLGLPDLLFGLSAVPVSWWARQGRVNDRFLLRWHLFGVLVVLTPLLGFMHLFMRDPLFDKWFEVPMMFAPALLGPSLLMLNLLVVWRLWETGPRQ